MKIVSYLDFFLNNTIHVLYIGFYKIFACLFMIFHKDSDDNLWFLNTTIQILNIMLALTNIKYKIFITL